MYLLKVKCKICLKTAKPTDLFLNPFQFKVSFLFHLKNKIRNFPMVTGIIKGEILRFSILISIPISDHCFHSNLNPLGLTLGFLVFSLRLNLNNEWLEKGQLDNLVYCFYCNRWVKLRPIKSNHKLLVWCSFETITYFKSCYQKLLSRAVLKMCYKMLLKAVRKNAA